MADQLLKITYHGAAARATKKLNAYLSMPYTSVNLVRSKIEKYLFMECQLPQSEIRIYWIDADADEIEILNQNDYDVFLSKCAQNMHVQIATIAAEKEIPKQEPGTSAVGDSSPEKEASNFIIHDGVQCDACDLHPIVGFRYKCVQCPNFDLCQGCEALHKHPDHLMVRMPTNNGPSIIDAWLSGPGTTGSHHHHRRSGRRFRSGQCPFAEATAASTQTTPTTGTTPAAAAAADSHKEGRRERRHARRQGQGVLSQFVEMMMHLPEADAAEAGTEPSERAAATTAPSAPKEESLNKTEAGAQSTEAPKVPVTEKEPVTVNAEEPVAAPRTKEQPSAAPTPTTPVISLENLAQMVNPEYMRAGIEILNNFSEMFAKMIDPNEVASLGTVGNSTSNESSTDSSKPEKATEAPQKPETAHVAPQKPETATVAPQKTETKPETVKSQPESVKSSISGDQTPPVVVPVAEPEERRRSESLDQDWQMIDNTASPIANVSSSDALINLNGASPANSTVASEAEPASYRVLSNILQKHLNEEKQHEQSSTTAHTQTSQVDTVSTSTSTTPVATNTTSTSTTTGRPLAPEEKRAVPIYHTNEQINSAVHAMMAMGFSNEGAWLTQLLESVEGNIPAALDIMHTSQSGRN